MEQHTCSSDVVTNNVTLVLRRMTCKTSADQVWAEKMLRELWKDVAYADYIGGAPWVQCVIIIYCDLAL